MAKLAKEYHVIDLRVHLRFGSETQKQIALGFVNALRSIFELQYNGRRIVWPYGHKDNYCEVEVIEGMEVIGGAYRRIK